MVLAINSLGKPRIKSSPRFRKSLFTRLGFLVVVFTIALTAVLYYQFDRSFTTQDSILDAHESYYYSQMVSSWGNPPDTNYVVKEINKWCYAYWGNYDLDKNTIDNKPTVVIKSTVPPGTTDKLHKKTLAENKE